VSVQLEQPPGVPVRRRRRSLVLAAVVLAVLLVGGVATWALWPSTPEERLIDALRQESGDSGGTASTCGPPLHEAIESLGELSSRSHARWPDGSEHALTDAVAVGQFTELEPGQGFVVPTDDRNDLPVAFDDPDAPYRTVHARLEVDSVLSGEIDGAAVLVGFHVRGARSDWEHLPTLETAEEGLPALGRVVLFSDRTSLWDFDHRPLTGVFLAQVDQHGRLSLPLVPRDHADRLVAATPDLTSLEDALADPDQTLVIDDCNHRLD
jgi:hypothetical protein